MFLCPPKDICENVIAALLDILETGNAVHLYGIDSRVVRRTVIYVNSRVLHICEKEGSMVIMLSENVRHKRAHMK